MEPATDAGDAGHQAFREPPDVGLFAEDGADGLDQFVGREGFVVAHVVDSGGDVLGQDPVDRKADVLHRREGPAVIKRPEGPWDAFGDYAIQQVEIAFVARAVDHARAEDVHLLVLRHVREDVFLRPDLALAIRPDRGGNDILREDAFHPVRRCFRRAEEHELPRRRSQEVIENLLRQPRIDLEIHLGRRLVLRVVRLPGQMDDGIHLRHAPGVQVLPTERARNTLLRWRDDVKPINGMPTGKGRDQVAAHKTMDASN